MPGNGSILYRISYIGVNGYQKSSAIVISSVWSPSANSSSFSDPQAGAGRGGDGGGVIEWPSVDSGEPVLVEPALECF